MLLQTSRMLLPIIACWVGREGSSTCKGRLEQKDIILTCRRSLNWLYVDAEPLTTTTIYPLQYFTAYKVLSHALLHFEIIFGRQNLYDLFHFLEEKLRLHLSDLSEMMQWVSGAAETLFLLLWITLFGISDAPILVILSAGQESNYSSLYWHLLIAMLVFLPRVQAFILPQTPFSLF